MQTHLSANQSTHTNMLVIFRIVISDMCVSDWTSYADTASYKPRA